MRIVERGLKTAIYEGFGAGVVEMERKVYLYVGKSIPTGLKTHCSFINTQFGLNIQSSSRKQLAFSICFMPILWK